MKADFAASARASPPRSSTCSPRTKTTPPQPGLPGRQA